MTSEKVAVTDPPDFSLDIAVGLCLVTWRSPERPFNTVRFGDPGVEILLNRAVSKRYADNQASPLGLRCDGSDRVTRNSTGFRNSPSISTISPMV